MLKYNSERNVPHTSSMVRKRHANLQKLTTVTRPSQGKQRGKPLKPGGPPTQGKKVGLTVRQTSQRDREKADEANVVSISELRHILRLAEPLSYEKNERAPVEPNFNEKEQHTHETSAVECRVVSTPRDNVENRVTEKAPVVRSGLPPGHLTKTETVVSSDGIFFPFGSPGGGAPIKTSSGELKADYYQRAVASQQISTVSTKDWTKQDTMLTQNQKLSSQQQGPNNAVNMTSQDVLPQRYGRTVPHAMRSSFFFGTSYGADADTKSLDKRQWLEDLRKQVEDKKAREAAENQRRKVIDEGDALRDMQHQMWQSGSAPCSTAQIVTSSQVYPSVSQLPAAPPAIQTESPDKAFVKGNDERSHQHQYHVLLDSSDIEEKRRRTVEHYQFNQQQLEEKQRIKREHQERLAKEVAIEDARLHREREQLRLQYEREQAAAREREEIAIRRRELLEEQIVAAQAAAAKERHARVRRHVGRISPLEVLTDNRNRTDVELPSSGKVLTLQASRHVFMDSPYVESEKSASIDSMLECDVRAVDATLSMSELCEAMPSTPCDNSEDVKAFQKQASKEHQGPTSAGMKVIGGNQRYRQKQSVVEYGSAMKGAKKQEKTRRHTIATVRKPSHVNHSSRLPVPQRRLEGTQFRVKADAVVVDDPARSKDTSSRLQAASSLRCLQEQKKVGSRTIKSQAVERKKSKQQRKSDYQNSDEDKGTAVELNSTVNTLSHAMHDRDSVAGKYVTDGPCESDDVEVCSLPSTGDAYHIPVQRTSVILPRVVDSMSSEASKRHLTHETHDKGMLQNVRARVTSAGGTQSQLLFNSNDKSELVEFKHEQQTVWPHPLQIPSTMSQVLQETRQYLENKRHDSQQEHWQLQPGSNTLQEVNATTSKRQREILSQLAFLRQGLVNKQKQLEEVMRDSS
ncbi:uncharacterized protein LOC134178270 isoform X2 [Corticium candelabrum]|uniref:uncharacterized protein LOC134178270 isoform X2 n=1 Tax=Corticium candelabrum TaxID=121492 RepID=UPI002E253D74|nr:uncharacterized protein LOC134178270 isoform X2 [Corticium candelabrum]